MAITQGRRKCVVGTYRTGFCRSKLPVQHESGLQHDAPCKLFGNLILASSKQPPCKHSSQFIDPKPLSSRRIQKSDLSIHFSSPQAETTDVTLRPAPWCVVVNRSGQADHLRSSLGCLLPSLQHLVEDFSLGELFDDFLLRLLEIFGRERDALLHFELVYPDNMVFAFELSLICLDLCYGTRGTSIVLRK